MRSALLLHLFHPGLNLQTIPYPTISLLTPSFSPLPLSSSLLLFISLLPLASILEPIPIPMPCLILTHSKPAARPSSSHAFPRSTSPTLPPHLSSILLPFPSRLASSLYVLSSSSGPFPSLAPNPQPSTSHLPLTTPHLTSTPPVSNLSPPQILLSSPPPCEMRCLTRGCGTAWVDTAGLA